MIHHIRQYLAARRLQRIVDATLASAKHKQFLKNSKAAKLGIARKRGMA